ncbi:MAG: glutathione S-transferase [Rhizobiales bacterium]|nr:glutathione S-transferase [Hyphomicrobiales bacterium]
MSETSPYKLYGSLGSPYSMKIRAYMRYRRIPHYWIHGGRAARDAQPNVKVPVIPIVQYPDGSWHNDSTPMIFDLEKSFPNDRGVMPSDPADAFLSFLLEDFGDEWLTKGMFHYRWFYERDQLQMSRYLAFDAFTGGGLQKLQDFADNFRDRQVGRTPLVGVTPENKPLIEESTRQICALFEAHVVNEHFLFGSRPSIAEFGLYGQMSQWGVDPTAADMLRADYPYTYRWLEHISDMSGIEGQWRDTSKQLPAIVTGLLKLAGQIYMPFLLANAKAIEAGKDRFSFEALGMPYSQGTFKYQVKCLAALRKAYAELPDAARKTLEPILSEAGCLETLQG